MMEQLEALENAESGDLQMEEAGGVGSDLEASDEEAEGEEQESEEDYQKDFGEDSPQPKAPGPRPKALWAPWASSRRPYNP